MACTILWCVIPEANFRDAFPLSQDSPDYRGSGYRFPLWQASIWVQALWDIYVHRHVFMIGFTEWSLAMQLMTKYEFWAVCKAFWETLHNALVLHAADAWRNTSIAKRGDTIAKNGDIAYAHSWHDMASNIAVHWWHCEEKEYTILSVCFETGVLTSNLRGA